MVVPQSTYSFFYFSHHLQAPARCSTNHLFYGSIDKFRDNNFTTKYFYGSDVCSLVSLSTATVSLRCLKTSATLMALGSSRYSWNKKLSTVLIPSAEIMHPLGSFVVPYVAFVYQRHSTASLETECAVLITDTFLYGIQHTHMYVSPLTHKSIPRNSRREVYNVHNLRCYRTATFTLALFDFFVETVTFFTQSQTDI